MSSEGVESIAEIRQRVGETISKIEALQSGKKPPFLSRISRHFKKNGGELYMVAVTGCMLVTALNRLDQKYKHEAS